ncbi:hypothetical protein CHS0354_023046 [Potamilus streckersoni]|uniref:Prohormone-4 n=1 Tax=Potamilus streckersoni TaxID=2493646 RepID=A0AAE0RW52_9BIVA|nr:hypothetical protein CHS0354_023046 [Potamilus streckersoni]
MDFMGSIFRPIGYLSAKSMRLAGKHESLVILLSLLCACTYGLQVDFSQLKQLRRPYIIDKRDGTTCTGNPCPPWKPFLCKTSSVCIALEYVCDDNPDCPDQFDEDKELCSARNRPAVEQIFEFLQRNRDWIIPKLFSGADPEMVAHGLSVATNFQELAVMVGISPKDRKNLEDVFTAVAEGDERPLLRLGMPRSNWYDVQFMLNKLIEGGLSS